MSYLELSSLPFLLCTLIGCDSVLITMSSKEKPLLSCVERFTNLLVEEEGEAHEVPFFI